jgi:hypothetical protein
MKSYPNIMTQINHKNPSQDVVSSDIVEVTTMESPKSEIVMVSFGS